MRATSTLAALVLLAPSLVLLADAMPMCPLQSTHTYVGPLGAVGVHSYSLGTAYKAGQVTVYDTNVADCNGDGVPFDRDGDWDFGIGGGFFGWGAWAGACGVNVHGPDVIVTDSLLLDVAFEIGADDMWGGDFGPCLTNGIIAPALEGDDCLTSPYLNIGQTCGGGGDGGFWVILDVLVEESWGGIVIWSPATVGTITAGFFSAPLNPPMDGIVKVTKAN